MKKDKKKAFILWLNEIGKRDTKYAGGKAASLGEMYTALEPLGIQVPNGFVVTTHAYETILKEKDLKKQIEDILQRVDGKDIIQLKKHARKVRQLLETVEFPEELEKNIIVSYEKLGKKCSVAVRSSATTEDTETASFAGQQDTYLHIVGKEEVLKAIKKTIASLFTDRAISYRMEQNLSPGAGSMAVVVQEMAQADDGVSGVLFTAEPETGFSNALLINASYGLGELIVGGEVNPDEYIVFKPLVEKERVARNPKAIIGKRLGQKMYKLVTGTKGTKKVSVPIRERNLFCLSDKEIIQLAKQGLLIEKHFKKPMDIEWVKNEKGKICIIQARPDTTNRNTKKNVYREYLLRKKGNIVSKGAAVGTAIATGKARVIPHVRNMNELKAGEVLVTSITNPDWEPVLKGAAALVTDRGGRTSHAAIIAREFGIPAIVGTGDATKKIKDGQQVTIDCSSGNEGRVYQGKLPFVVREHRLNAVPKTKTKIMVNIGTPGEAFQASRLPVQGVGLGRLEFIISSWVGIHPNALIDYDVLEKKLKEQIAQRTEGYVDKKQYYIDRLSEGVARIAAAFWPNEVVIRFSDFKTNEYRQLIGGFLYEEEEPNPMLGWRGAARYYDSRFKEAFALECQAIKRVRQEMGLRNVTPMVPFCRTPEEAKMVRALIEEQGLGTANDQEFRVYMMCEIPSNVLLADEFLDVFDGMSIGSNDLTQLVLGIDRDAGVRGVNVNETNEAVKKMVASAISACRARGKYSGICGQAPSDYPEFTKFLVEQGIESISLNPDAIIPTIVQVAELEKKMNST